MIDKLLIAVVLLLYLKWIFIVLVYPLQVLWVLYQRNQDNRLYKVLAIPNKCVERLFRGGGGRFALFQISMIPSHRIRKLLYRGLGANIGAKSVFHFRTEIRAPWRLSVGEGTIIGDNALLDARSGLSLGRNVNLSSNVSIYTLQHDHRDPFFGTPDPKTRKLSVEIDNWVWLGSNVVVLPGVHIGEGAVCCAGCVVTKDVAPYSVVAGIPARQVGERPRVLQYQFNGKSCRLY